MVDFSEAIEEELQGNETINPIKQNEYKNLENIQKYMRTMNVATNRRLCYTEPDEAVSMYSYGSGSDYYMNNNHNFIPKSHNKQRSTNYLQPFENFDENECEEEYL